jgi:FKBP-type peptidyl-prolyl cis-trans isomerase SlyD
MIIAKDTAVTLEYTLSDENGETLESSKGREPLTYIHGSGSLIKGFEQAMEGKSPKDNFSFTVKPEDGYGEKNPDLFFQAPREQFTGLTDELAVGMPLRVQTSNGPMIVTVAGIEDERVLLDGNHPLAGKSLTFAVEVLDVRQATEEELEDARHESQGCGDSCGSSCGDSSCCDSCG